jgi:hypothetical protein
MLSFQGQHFGIITKHEKELIIGPLLQQAFGATFERIDFDTDTLGTFSGEVERPADQRTTAMLKVQHAQQKGIDFYIASEGAFYPHPEVPFLTVNTELLVCYAAQADYTITAISNSFDVTAAQIEVNDWDAVATFAAKIGFPAQGVILHNHHLTVNERMIIKDATTWDALALACKQLLATNERITVMADLRAMRNPKRSTHIAAVAANLIERMQQYCTRCQYPGFGISNAVAGLPCCWCGTPTKAIAYYELKCEHCGHIAQQKTSQPCADPGGCDVCNP